MQRMEWEQLAGRNTNLRSIGVGALVREGKGFAGIGKKGDVVQGVISQIADKISIDFSGQEVKVDAQSLTSPVVGQKRSFQIMEISDSKISLKDVTQGLDTQSQPILCTQIAQTGFSQKLEQSVANAKQQACDAKQLLEQIKGSMSEETYGNLSSEVISFEKLSPAELSLAVQKIQKQNLEKKNAMEQKHQEHQEYQESLERAGVKAALERGIIGEQLVGNVDVGRILRMLEEYDIPATSEKITNVLQAYDQTKELPKLKDDTLANFIKTQEVLTPKTLYQSLHVQSGAGHLNLSRVGIQTGYQNYQNIQNILNDQNKNQNNYQNNYQYKTQDSSGVTLSNSTVLDYRTGYGSVGITNRSDAYTTPDSGLLEKQSALFEELRPQIEKRMENDGIRVDEEQIRNAKWLFEHQLPVNGQKLRLLQGTLKLQEQEPAKEEFLDELTFSIVRGEKAEDTNLLLSRNMVRSSIQAFLAQLDELYVEESSSDDSLIALPAAPRLASWYMEESSSDDSLIALPAAPRLASWYMEESSSDDSLIALPGTKQESASISRLQLEQIRLQMSMQAGYRLMGKGISLDVSNLKQIVEQLEQQRDEEYRKFFDSFTVSAVTKEQGQGQNSQENSWSENRIGGISVEEALLQKNVRLLNDTVDAVELVKSGPASLLGETLSRRFDISISGISQMVRAQISQRSEYAAGAYETMQTQVRDDLGDDISKAFEKIPELLESLGLEDTEANERAVRILGYNQMELSQENIQNVKAYDAKMNALLEQLTPQTAVYLIREQIDPLHTPVYELSEQLSKIREEQGFSKQERFSTYLWKLEREKGISQEERNTYMGLYRLLHQVEKSDGAVIGTLLQQGRPMTLSNLLDAVRLRKSKGVDVKADEQFGGIELAQSEKENISQQLEGFSGNAHLENSLSENSGQGKKSSGDDFLTALPAAARLASGDKEAFTSTEQMEQPVQEQQLYHQQLVEEILSQITPEKIKNMVSENAAGQSFESFSQLSLEKLHQLLSSRTDPSEIDSEYLSMQTEEFMDTISSSDDELYFLSALHEPATYENILGASLLQGPGRQLYERLQRGSRKEQWEKVKQLSNQLQEQMDVPEKLSENSQKLSKLAEEIVDEQVEQQMEQAVNGAVSGVLLQEDGEDKADARLSLKELKRLSAGVSLTKSLGRREHFVIPIVTEEHITNMNVTFVSGSETAGRVHVKLSAAEAGTVEAECSLKNDKVNVSLFTDSSELEQELLQKETKIRESLEMKGLKVNHFSIGTDKNISRIFADESSRVEKPLKLYQVAKCIVMQLREVV